MGISSRFLYTLKLALCPMCILVGLTHAHIHTDTQGHHCGSLKEWCQGVGSDPATLPQNSTYACGTVVFTAGRCGKKIKVNP